jgi:SWIM zinc finger
MLLAFTNIKRALQLFLNPFSSLNVGKVLSYGRAKQTYWVKYTIVIGLKVNVCVTFIKEDWLKHAFVELRKLGAKNVSLNKVSTFTYFANSGDEIHVVKIEGKKIGCNCEDMKYQLNTFGKGCCKHSYAILNLLGYNSLKQFAQNRGYK